jgi:3-oxoacyl-[acyl-carrier-protein] synthase III
LTITLQSTPVRLLPNFNKQRISMAYRSVITGSGSYIPSVIVENSHFLSHRFMEQDGSAINKSNEEIIERFKEITTISERRYLSDELNSSDMGAFAGMQAIESAGIDPEELDYIIVAHNAGEATALERKVDVIPSLGARIKQKMGIKNPATVAYDVIFGCPGWLQCVIQADYFIRSGDAKKILVIGTESLSRLCDPHDRDSMIYADGAGAVVLESKESDEKIGIIGHASQTDALEYCNMLFMGKSKGTSTDDLFLKMHGRRLYSYALQHVPLAIKGCLDKCGVDIRSVKKILIHQANGKMDEAILERLYKLYDIEVIPTDVMPMTISWLGNSSVATLPTLYDLIQKGAMPGNELNAGDTIVFASVGAGMSINAAVYRV